MHTNSSRHFLCSCLFGLALTSSCLAAEEEDAAPDYQANTLSGDWSGQRAELYRRGIAIDAGLKIDSLRNLSGGSSKGGTRMQNIDLKLRADLDQLFGWSGGTAFVHVLDNTGSGVNARHVGSLMGVTNIEVPVPTTRLFHAWVQQDFLDKQWAILAGLYPVDSEFSVMDSAGVFLHPAYGPSADFSLTRGPSIFNNSAFGLRLKWQKRDRTLYAMAAVLDGIPGDPARPRATSIRFAKGDGTFTIAEFGWTPIERGHLFEPTDPGRVLQMPDLRVHEKYEGFSKYAAGLWRYSSRVNDQFDVDAAGAPEKRRSWGGYLLAERTLWNIGNDAARHVSAFIRHGFTDGDSTAIRSQLNLGTHVRGALASRPDDILGLSWTRARLAAKYRAAQWRDNATDTVAAEEVTELTYRVQVKPWLAIQPDLQWIRHPGGASANTSVVAGVRLDLQL